VLPHDVVLRAGVLPRMRQVLLEEPELFDRNAPRVGVRAQALMATSDANRLLRHHGPGHERGGEESGDENGQHEQSWSDHGDLPLHVLFPPVGMLAGTRSETGTQSGTGRRQSMSRAAE